MAEKKLRSDLYTVKATFLFHGNQYFMAGQTVQAGHPVLKGRDSLFVPFSADHPWPPVDEASAVAEPPTPEPAVIGEPEPEPLTPEAT